MQHLQKRVMGVAEIIPRTAPLIYLDYPVHANIGDLLIEKGTERFFAHLDYNVVGCRSAHDFFSSAADRVTGEMTIVLHGGGNFGDLYGLHQAFRERVIEKFPDNRIVLLPQTIHFDSQARLEACARLFSRHRNLHVCLRDQRSLEIFKTHFDNPAYLIPDMAHFLWEEFMPHRAGKAGTRTLLFVRTDKELRPFSGAVDGLPQPVDWGDLIGLEDRIAFRTLNALYARGPFIGRWTSLHPLWRHLRDHLIAKAERLFQGYGTVKTNRLHAGIFALLMGRRAVLSDNSYGKLSGYYSTWLKDVPGAEFVSPASA